MIVDTSRLIKVKTYADKIGRTTTWIYTLIKLNKLISVEIDGVKFVVV